MPMEADFSRFVSLKGEFEAEGLSPVDIAAEALLAARHGLDYVVKVGGCEAKSDLAYLVELGIGSVVAPMIESAFAMEKYMEMLVPDAFHHVGVTIETETAVARIDAILDGGPGLTNVTVGRTDLVASYRGDSVESDRTIQMVKAVAKAAKSRGLVVTMGGSVSNNTRNTLSRDPELMSLLDFIETRKVVMSAPRFLEPDTLAHAAKLETSLLERRARLAERSLDTINRRFRALAGRV